MKNIETTQLPIHRRLGVGLALFGVLSGSVACAAEEEPTFARAEAHFSVVCPDGGSPGITEMAHSGALPEDPAGKLAYAVIRFACPESGRPPVIVQDTVRGGECLGYGKDSHLVVVATQPGEQAPEFFVAANQPEIGVTGLPDLAIRKAQIHHHELSDPFNQAAFDRNCANQ